MLVFEGDSVSCPDPSLIDEKSPFPTQLVLANQRLSAKVLFEFCFHSVFLFSCKRDFTLSKFLLPVKT